MAIQQVIYAKIPTATDKVIISDTMDYDYPPDAPDYDDLEDLLDELEEDKKLVIDDTGNMMTVSCLVTNRVRPLPDSPQHQSPCPRAQRATSYMSSLYRAGQRRRVTPPQAGGSSCWQN